MQETSIHIGTSGWSYDHWRFLFYPEKLACKERLRYYSHFFSTVEVNSTFYHLPSEQTLLNWAEETPKNFIFALKASRYITHQKKLTDPVISTKNFFQRAQLLKSKLGPILFQLPPSFALDLKRLEEFIAFLPKKFSYSFEFRNSSWNDDKVYALLRKYNVALCFGDLDGVLSPLEVTADFTYMRLHGPKKAYLGSYSDQQLKKWAKRIEGWAAQGLSIYCFFNNDEGGCALRDAARLLQIVEANLELLTS